MSDKTFKNDYLLPCQCGEERAFVKVIKPGKWCKYQAVCDSCESRWPLCDTEAEAIVAGNVGCWRDVERDGLPEVKGVPLVRSYLASDGGRVRTLAFGSEGWGYGICGKRGFVPRAWMPLPPAHETGEER
jgi:hypothetical protein